MKIDPLAISRIEKPRRRPGNQAGKTADFAEALDRGEPLGLAIDADLGALLERERPAVAIQATCSRLADAEREIAACLERGVHVISIAEEMAWPAAASPECAARLDALARSNGAAVVGTGVNPGFVLDTLVVTLTAVCARVESIRARRVNDLAPYGPTVLRSQGVGLEPEAFRAAVDDGRVVGHVGFPESIAMIASALGWKLERVEELGADHVVVTAQEDGSMRRFRDEVKALTDGRGVEVVHDGRDHDERAFCA